MSAKDDEAAESRRRSRNDSAFDLEVKMVGVGPGSMAAGIFQLALLMLVLDQRSRRANQAQRQAG